MILRVFVNKGKVNSSPWRIWDHNEELYISTRNLGGVFKASLHKSTSLNFSFTYEYFSEGNIEPKQPIRHIGSESLNISTEDIQIVFQIPIPIEWMSECNFKKNKMRSVTLKQNDNGTVLIQVIHVPNIKKESLDENKIPNFLGFFCDKKYVVAWNLSKNLFLNSYHTNKHIEFGNIQQYDKNTRAVTFGYSKDKRNGFFLDILYSKLRTTQLKSSSSYKKLVAGLNSSLKMSDI